MRLGPLMGHISISPSPSISLPSLEPKAHTWIGRVHGPLGAKRSWIPMHVSEMSLLDFLGLYMIVRVLIFLVLAWRMVPRVQCKFIFDTCI